MKKTAKRKGKLKLILFVGEIYRKKSSIIAMNGIIGSKQDYHYLIIIFIILLPSVLVFLGRKLIKIIQLFNSLLWH